MPDPRASSPRPATASADAGPSRTLRYNASVSTSTTASSSSFSHRDPPLRRKIPLYVRIVQKDIWLRFHVHLNGTIGSIKDLALQKANAPEFDPTHSSYFYNDAVNVSAAVKVMPAVSQQSLAKYRTDLLPKSFVAACPRPAPSLPRVGSRSVEVYGSHAGKSGYEAGLSASTSRSRWKERVDALHTGGGRFRQGGELLGQQTARAASPLGQQRAAAPVVAEQQPVNSSPDPHERRSRSRAELDARRGNRHDRTVSLSRRDEALSPATSQDLDTRASPASQRPAQLPKDSVWQPSFGASLQLPLDAFAGGNAEAKEEEARALARLSGWTRILPAPGDASAGRRSIDEAISGLTPSPLADSSRKVTAARSADPFSDETSEDELGPSLASPSQVAQLLPSTEAAESTHSLSETASSSSSAGLLTTTEADGLWGTQLEEKLLSDQRRQRNPADGGSRPVTSQSDRSRSRTVTAADVTRGSSHTGHATTSAAATPHQRINSVPSNPGPLRAAASQTFESEKYAVSATAASAASTPSSAAARGGGGASSPWLDRGRLAGINLDEMSQWREATHGASDRFSIYSFSNGLLLEDWKTVAAYRLKPFELLELQSASPVERVHLAHDIAGAISDAAHHNRQASLSAESASLEAYYEGWVYVLKPSSTSTRQTQAAAKVTIGTWKLRWLTIRGWKMDLYRKKPKPGESSTPVSACYWHLSLLRWVTSEKLDTGSNCAANPPLPALESVPPYSLTVAFSAASWTAAMPSEFTLPTSGSSITIRCITKYDHDALYNVLNRAHFRTVTRGKDSAELSMLVDGWRSNAVVRATIAGRGGTVQPGRLARTRAGRNAMNRTRLRPPGWPSDWEDADTWSSSSEAEDILPSESVWQYDLGLSARTKPARTNSAGVTSTTGVRRSLDAERLPAAASAHGLRAAYLQQQPQAQGQLQHGFYQATVLQTKRSSSPLNPSTPPSTLGRRSKLVNAVESMTHRDSPSRRDGAEPEKEATPAPTSLAAAAATTTQTSPSRSRGFSLSRSSRNKAASPSSRKNAPKMPETDSARLHRPDAAAAAAGSSPTGGDGSAFRPDSSGRSRAHTISSSASPSPSRPPATSVFAPLRRNESRRTSNDTKRLSGSAAAATSSATPTSQPAPSPSAQAPRAGNVGGHISPPPSKQDIPIAFIPSSHHGAHNESVPRSVALLKRLKQRSVVGQKASNSSGSGGGGAGRPSRPDSPSAL